MNKSGHERFAGTASRTKSAELSKWFLWVDFVSISTFFKKTKQKIIKPGFRALRR